MAVAVAPPGGTLLTVVVSLAISSRVISQVASTLTISKSASVVLLWPLVLAERENVKRSTVIVIAAVRE